MPEEKKSDSNIDATHNRPLTAAITETQSVSLNKSHLVTFCAAGLLVCFFLPWINLLFCKPTGLDFAKDGGKGLLLWAIPIFSALTIVAGVTKRSQKHVAQFAGLLPFFALGFGLYNSGTDLMHILEVGAYGSLALGLLLIILPRGLK